MPFVLSNACAARDHLFSYIPGQLAPSAPMVSSDQHSPLLLIWMRSTRTRQPVEFQYLGSEGELERLVLVAGDARRGGEQLRTVEKQPDDTLTNGTAMAECPVMPAE